MFPDIQKKYWTLTLIPIIFEMKAIFLIDIRLKALIKFRRTVIPGLPLPGLYSGLCPVFTSLAFKKS